MPRAFNEDERLRLRSRLIETGKRLLNRLSLQGLRVDDAAKEAGISKGSFYAFFPSKEDYVLSIFESWEKELREPLLAGVLCGGGEGRKRLEDFFLGALAILEREPGLARLGFREIALIMERLPPERLAAHRAADEAVMGRAAASWIEAGIIAPEDLPALKGLLDALFILAMHREDFGKGEYDAATRLMAEALAARFAARAGKGMTLDEK